MRKIYFLFLSISLIMCSFVRVQAQSNDLLNAFSSAGATVISNEEDFISYTFGQTVFRSMGNGTTVTAGVQQVFCVPSLTEIEMDMCTNEAVSRISSLLPQGYQLPQEVTNRMPGSYNIALRVLAEGGCDSLVYITLNIHATSDTILQAQASGSYLWHDENYRASGVYSETLKNQYGCDSTVRLKLSVMPSGVPMPQIYSEDGRTIKVNHSAADGSEVNYAYYRWYRDGERMDGASGTANDSYSESNITLSGCYYVEVPTDETLTYWVKSNELCMNATGIKNVEQENVLTLMPNPVRRGGVLRVEIDVPDTRLSSARIVVYDAQGRRVVERGAMRTTTLTADWPSGVYSVHLIMANGSHSARKVIVK